MSIKINSICKSFGPTKALKKVSFEAKSGDIVGLLGPNGAGKSTLMKVITGYYEQDAGTISICNKDTLKNEIFTKNKIGYLSEENPLYEDMYVREFLEFICSIHKISPINCAEMMKLTGLNDVKHKKITVSISFLLSNRLDLSLISAELSHDFIWSLNRCNFLISFLSLWFSSHNL